MLNVRDRLFWITIIKMKTFTESITKNIHTSLSYSFLALALSGCGGGSGTNTDAITNADTVTAQTLYEGSLSTTSKVGAAEADLTTLLQSCEQNNRAVAEQISNPNFKLSGSNSLGSAGDYLLSNDKAAFVITGAGPQKTYFHYHGILVDAAPLENCIQAGDENFYELALMAGKLNFANQSGSTIRAFKGADIEVINDGSDGEAAIVRVHGSDEIYWLLEYELIQRAFESGQPKGISSPFGLDITVDYILEPGSPTLKIVYQLENQLNEFNSISAAFSLLSSGNGPSINSFSSFDVNVEGLELQYGIPWITAYSEQSTYIYGVNSNQLVTTHIQGVDAVIDASQLSNTWLGQLLAPAGESKDTLTREFFVSVSPSDEVSAIKEYLDSTPKTVDTIPTPVSALVIDKVTGDPIEGAIIEFQTKTQVFLESWPWNTFATTYTDANGLSTSDVPLISYLKDQQYRAIATIPGRENSEPLAIVPTQDNQLLFQMAPQGALQYNITDASGQPMPAQISFWQGDTRVARHYTQSGSGSFVIPPGDYDIGISRGFEYNIVEMPITIGPDSPAQITASLTRMVDTSGYMSFDAHVHSSPSPDSEVAPVDRITTAAATGLEVVVSTDHEIITDLEPAINSTNLDPWVATVIGQEVTATLPNHTIAYPIVRDVNDPRGGPVPWYGLDIAGIFAAEKARGAQVRTIAHPRSSYLNHIEWDRIAGKPGVDELTDLAFADDAELWSWDFEALEYQNGPQNVFETGLFLDWMSFLNHGHRITATGASDVHGANAPGMPRTYFRSSTDNPEVFVQDDMISAVQGNQAIVSTGAFATVIANGSGQVGDIITDRDGTVSLQITVQATPSVDIDHVKVYMNCDEVEHLSATNPADSAIKLQGTYQITIPTDKDAHIVILGFGINEMPREFPQYNPEGAPRVTTNPVFIDTDGNGLFDAPGGKQCNI